MATKEQAMALVDTTLDSVENMIDSRITMWRNKPSNTVAKLVTHTNRITELETVMSELRKMRREMRKVVRDEFPS